MEEKKQTDKGLIKALDTKTQPKTQTHKTLLEALNGKLLNDIINMIFLYIGFIEITDTSDQIIGYTESEIDNIDIYIYAKIIFIQTELKLPSMTKLLYLHKFIGKVILPKVSSCMFINNNTFTGDGFIADTSAVEYMSCMFSGASKFGYNEADMNMDTWDVSKVKRMEGMFTMAYYFNHNISNWDVSKVVNMEYMFNGAYNFNYDLSKWIINIDTKKNNILKGAITFLTNKLKIGNTTYTL